MSRPEPLHTLTDLEVAALEAPFNLADGHARHSQARFLERLRLSTLSGLVDPFTYRSVESEFITGFFTLARQLSAIDQSTLLAPSASMSLELVANLMRMRGLRARLLEPCFDNIALIFKRHGVQLSPLVERDLHSAPFALGELAESMAEDALVLVLPNNPTGFTLERSDFETLAYGCAAARKLLVLDFSFRFFSTQMATYDQYEILAKSGCEYIAIEDTGKTWPTFDLKASAVTASASLFAHLLRIHREIFLEMSPISLVLLRDVIRDTIDEGVDSAFGALVHTNRSILRRAIADSILTPITVPNVSVEWLRISDSAFTDETVVTALEQQGIHVLPGRPFFWSRTDPTPFIRIALLRDTTAFASASLALARALQAFARV